MYKGLKQELVKKIEHEKNNWKYQAHTFMSDALNEVYLCF